MKSEYEVVVVGAGPAGLTVARVTAAAGLRVLVLDKKREIGVPVRCAEGVGTTGSEEIVNMNPRWVDAYIDRARFHAPDGSWVEIENDSQVKGYILNRTVMERDLAEEAGARGAEIRLKSYADGLLFHQGKPCGVSVKSGHTRYQVHGRVMAACDGVESRVGRWAGIDTTVKPHDMEVCYQYLLANVDVEPGRFEFYVGRQVVPGGYLWVFPKGKRRANVGLGISGDEARNRPPRFYLDRFVEEKFPRAIPLTATACGVPCGREPKRLVGDGLVLVGDAARLVNPITGGGIASAFKAGRMAGTVISEGIKQDDVSAGKLSAYERLWDSAWGWKHRRFYRIKEIVYKLDDEDINAAASILRSLDIKELTVAKLFAVSLRKHPALLLDIAKAFAGTITK